MRGEVVLPVTENTLVIGSGAVPLLGVADSLTVTDPAETPVRTVVSPVVRDMEA